MSAGPLGIVRQERVPAPEQPPRESGRSAWPQGEQKHLPSLSAEAITLYRVLARRGPQALGDVPSLLGEPARWPDPVQEWPDPVQELRALGLVREGGGWLAAVPFVDVVDQLVHGQAQLLSRTLDDLHARHRKLQLLLREGRSLGGVAGETVWYTALDGPDAAPPSPRSGHPGQVVARHDLAVMHPGARFEEDVLEASLARVRDDVGRGIRLRALHQSSVLAHPRSVTYLRELERLGVQVRLRNHLPFRLILVDGRAAVCSPPDPIAGRGSFILHGQQVVELLEQVFETVWVESASLAAATNRPDRGPTGATEVVLTDQQQAIMRHLADGQTDQAIARALGITPRTVTRRLAEIYQVLGVHSRFQAGATAHRLGLI